MKTINPSHTNLSVQKGCSNHTGESYFLLIDLDCNIVTFNDAFAKFINLSTAQSTSRKITDCLNSSQSEVLMEMVESARNGEGSHREILITDESNTVHYIRLEVTPSYDLKNQVIGITCIGTDLGKEKIQLEKIAMQKMLLKEIATTYSHQLRHPLTNILAVISLLKHDDLKMSKLYFECLEKASKQMDKVIKSVAMQLYKAA
jgi:PAS domain S-box-containing protein